MRLMAAHVHCQPRKSNIQQHPLPSGGQPSPGALAAEGSVLHAVLSSSLVSSCSRVRRAGTRPAPRLPGRSARCSRVCAAGRALPQAGPVTARRRGVPSSSLTPPQHAPAQPQSLFLLLCVCSEGENKRMASVNWGARAGGRRKAVMHVAPGINPSRGR